MPNKVGAGIDVVARAMSGNLSVETFKVFPSSWESANTPSEFFEAVVETNPVVRDAYLGPIAWSTGMPSGVGNAEVTLTVSAPGVYVLQMTSSNVYPYHWEMTSVGTSYEDWRSWDKVDGNDPGTATHTLQTIKIGNTVYRISGTAVAMDSYSALVSSLNSAAKGGYPVGQSIFIKTLHVPDTWVYSNNESSSVQYTYTTDEQFLADIESAGGALQIGYHKISILESEKIDLTNYVQKTDYASSSVGGVIKSSSTYGTSVTVTGELKAAILTYLQYASANGEAFTSIETLKNVIANSLVRFDISTNLTSEDKARARGNIDAMQTMILHVID